MVMSRLMALGRRMGRRIRANPVRHALQELPPERVPLKVAIAGLGQAGALHLTLLRENPLYEVVGVCTRKEGKPGCADLAGLASFRDLDTLLCSVVPDVLVIATPHRCHVDAAITALEADVHVICEKPVGVAVHELPRLLRAADESTARITVVSQTRYEPSYRYVKGLVASGRLGAIHRCHITETFWRSQAYYDAVDWRGTWGGEGGGVLLNQAVHVLDRYIWLCGRPESVLSLCDSSLHDIAVEDTASLLFRHTSGAHGHVHVNTGEAPHVSRLELAGEFGRVEVLNGCVVFSELNESSRERIRADVGHTGSVDAEVHRLGGRLLNWAPELLHEVYNDFADAVWSGREPAVGLDEACDVVEVVNAAYLSSHKGSCVHLPVDRADYQNFLQSMNCDSVEGP